MAFNFMSLLNPIGAIANTVTSAINSRREQKVAQSNTDKTIQANRELAEYQYSKNLEQWNRENAYNSPESQMSRLSAAGLNPNLVYGNGSVSGNTTTAGVRFQTPDVNYRYQARRIPSIPEISTYLQDYGLKEAELANRKSSNNVLNAQASKLKMDTYNSALDSFNRMLNYSRGKLDYKLKSQLYKYNLEAGKLAVDKARKDIERSDVSISQMRQMTRNLGLDYDYKSLKNKLYRLGVGDSDGFLIRMLSRLLVDDDALMNLPPLNLSK